MESGSSFVIVTLLQLQRAGVVDLHGVFGSPRHFGVRVSFPSLAREKNLSGLDTGRIVPVGGGVGGNGISCLLGPVGE